MGSIFAVITYELIYWGRPQIVPVAVPATSAAGIAGTAIPSELASAGVVAPGLGAMDSRLPEMTDGALL